MHHHTWLSFEFLVETELHHVGQAGLELLTSNDVPAWASQSAEMTDVHHLAQPQTLLSIDLRSSDKLNHLLTNKFLNPPLSWKPHFNLPHLSVPNQSI